MENLQNITLGDINNAHKKIATLKENRDIDNANVKAKKKSILDKGMLSHIYIMPAKDAIKNKLTPLNDKNEEISEVDADNYYCIYDGHHRYQALNELQLSKQIDMIKYSSVVFSLNTSGKIGLDTLIEMNNTSKQWNVNDYIKTAKLKNSDNDVIDYIYDLQENYKMTPASISKYISFSNKINKSILSQLAINPDALNGINIDIPRAKKIISTLEKVGFDKKFIKSRYIIDEIVSIGNTDKALELIGKLSEDDVKYIMEKKDCSKLKINKEQSQSL